MSAENDRIAAELDGGFGVLAVAAIAAQPVGPARAVEATKWAALCVTGGTVAYPITGDTTDDELDAYTELTVALNKARRA